MDVTYTDGSRVKAGDRIRYRQAPGGLLPPGPEREGIAAPYPRPEAERQEMRAHSFMDPDELHLLTPEGRYYHLFSHIIERLA